MVTTLFEQFSQKWSLGTPDPSIDIILLIEVSSPEVLKLFPRSSSSVPNQADGGETSLGMRLPQLPLLTELQRLSYRFAHQNTFSSKA